jgi:hypothetical protein
VEDIDIVKSIQAGDSEMYALLVEKYHRHLLNFIYRLVGNEQLVEDIGQEVFFSVYKSLRSFNVQRGEKPPDRFPCFYGYATKSSRRRKNPGTVRVRKRAPGRYPLSAGTASGALQANHTAKPAGGLPG